MENFIISPNTKIQLIATEPLLFGSLCKEAKNWIRENNIPHCTVIINHYDFYLTQDSDIIELTLNYSKWLVNNKSI